ncbi:MAG: Glu/Leu/Phe/Val dehydrogenase [Nitrospirae bacterium]|nr:Glu/Leu/Phe/Val dehydrogenase [Nitrospirota bacterium]
MDLFKVMAKEGHEQLVVSTDPETGLRAIIAIHSTLLGPSLGGCRFWFYKTFDEAAADALRLSRAMTYKAAICGLNLGGGKAVISARPEEKTPALLRAFGRAVDSLAGLYFTAEDVGMTLSDLDVIREVTRYATGIPEDRGGSGDPSVMTARGVLHGMRRCLIEVFGSDSFRGRTVAVQGLGKVGRHLVELLHREEADLIVSDLDASRVRDVTSKMEAKVLPPSRIPAAACDIFAPCAMGGVLNSVVIPKLRCRIVAGSANNQLAMAEGARRLQKRGILYAPDYVINAGGLINIACEMEGYRKDRAEERVAGITENLARVFARAKEEKITPLEAADRLAEERLAKARADRSPV